jgi:hypothetical protein
MIIFENSDGEYVRYKDRPQFKGRGGARNVKDNPFSANIYARLLPEDKEKYLALGGSEWLREAIKRDYAAKAYNGANDDS